MPEFKDELELLFGGIRQENRLLKLDTPLGTDVLLPQRVHAFDRISEGYDYTVDVLSLGKRPAVPPMNS